MEIKQSNFCLIAACITTLFIFTISCTSDLGGELSDYELTGNVKKVLIAEFEPVQRFGEVENDAPIQFSVQIFNEHGLILESEHYNEDGDMTWRIKHFHIDDGSQHTHHHIYRNGADKHGKAEYAYTNLGKLSVLDIFDTDGELSTKYVLEYDEQGGLSEENIYYGDGSLWIRRIFKTNEVDNSTTIAAYDSDGESIGTTVYSLNERDERITVKYKNKETTEEHKHIERDQNDNWTNKLITENGEPSKIIYRSIEYFNGTVTGEYELISNSIN